MCIGRCVLYKGRIYEVVGITNNGLLTITNGRVSKLEVEIQNVIFLEDSKKGMLIETVS